MLTVKYSGMRSQFERPSLRTSYHLPDGYVHYEHMNKAPLYLLLLTTPALPQPASFPLDSLTGLEAKNIKMEAANYRGRRCVRLLDQPSTAGPAGQSAAILTESDFGDGPIEAEVAGSPRSGAIEAARGFIGIAFRVQPKGDRFECFYIRPTNGRADDQLRRNHSTQYVSEPDFPWNRLRQENPGMYESYADMQPGVWTKMKIVVAGLDARLYVNGADQPCLIVHDLKMGKTRGKIALWVGVDTDGYFSNLRVTPTAP